MRGFQFRNRYVAEHREQWEPGGVFLAQCGCMHWARDHCPHCGHCSTKGCKCEEFKGE